MRRVGVLGGTFDPVHVGHVGVALAVRDRLRLPRVDLVPCHVPPHRADHRTASAWHRYAMVVLATAAHARLLASDRELRRGGVSYMVDTLRGYRRESPPLDPVLILGIDAFAELPSWRQPKALVSEFDIVVVNRSGVDRELAMRGLPSWITDRLAPVSLLRGSSRHGSAGGRIGRLDLPRFPVSATGVRGRLRRGRRISGLVDRAVAAYISKYHLYSEE